MKWSTLLAMALCAGGCAIVLCVVLATAEVDSYDSSAPGPAAEPAADAAADEYFAELSGNSFSDSALFAVKRQPFDDDWVVWTMLNPASIIVSDNFRCALEVHCTPGALGSVTVVDPKTGECWTAKLVLASAAGEDRE